MPRFNQPPIPRSVALQPLSRDHYRRLVQAQHLVKASDSDAIERRKVLAEFLDAWSQELAEHLIDEEQLLLGRLSRADRDRLIEEHSLLREAAEQAQQQRRESNPDALILRQLGQRLHDHIRWEERELFTKLEKQLDTAELARLALQTAKIEARRPRHCG